MISLPRLFRAPALAGAAPVAPGFGLRRLRPDEAAHRRRSGHHQQPGADQHGRALALARRHREAGDLPGRDRARRHQGPGIHPLALAQRVLPGHRGLSRRNSTSTSPASRSPSACPSEGGPAPGAEPHMGPISTGSGEIYMWSVHYAKPPSGRSRHRASQAGSRTAAISRPRATAADRAGADRLPAHGPGLDLRPQVKTVPGGPVSNVVGGFEKQYHVQPDPTKLASLDLSFSDVARALQANNANQGARYLEDNGEGYVVARRRPPGGHGGDRERPRHRAQRRPGAGQGHRRGPHRRDLRTGSGSEDWQEVVIGTALMLIARTAAPSRPR